MDGALLGWHIEQGAGMTFEAIGRHIEDTGGGLACVDGRPRLIEGMALPSQEIEARPSLYNSNTVWIDIDRLLDAFGLSRPEMEDAARVTVALPPDAHRDLVEVVVARRIGSNGPALPRGSVAVRAGVSSFHSRRLSSGVIVSLRLVC